MRDVHVVCATHFIPYFSIHAYFQPISPRVGIRSSVCSRNRKDANVVPSTNSRGVFATHPVFLRMIVLFFTIFSLVLESLWIGHTTIAKKCHNTIRSYNRDVENSCLEDNIVGRRQPPPLSTTAAAVPPTPFAFAKDRPPSERAKWPTTAPPPPPRRGKRRRLHRPPIPRRT